MSVPSPSQRLFPHKKSFSFGTQHFNDSQTCNNFLEERKLRTYVFRRQQSLSWPWIIYPTLAECESASGIRADSAEYILRPQMPFLLEYLPIYKDVLLILFLSRLLIKFSTRKQNKRSSMWNEEEKMMKIHGAGIVLHLLLFLGFLNIPKQEIRLNNTKSQFRNLRKQDASRWQRSIG
jgi:hypothetical protein